MDTSFMDFQIQRVARMKDELLLKVAQQCLGRELVFDADFQNFQLVTHVEKPGREFIGYMGNMIGEIVFYWKEEDNQIKFGYEFQPKTGMD